MTFEGANFTRRFFHDVQDFLYIPPPSTIKIKWSLPKLANKATATEQTPALCMSQEATVLAEKKKVYFIRRRDTVNFQNFRMPETFAVNYLKFKQRLQILGFFVKKMQMEWQTVKTLIRLLLYLPRPICQKS